MGTNHNHNNGNRPPGIGNLGLTRQPSIYSLTFEELQSTMGLEGIGKDFGSLNMDELLKNIWTAEESQICAAAAASTVQEGTDLQRQGSFTLPRTLSQKTVEEVWKDLSKEYDDTGGTKNNVTWSSNTPQAQRQLTLGEITLEEFLVRAGVVREDAQLGAGGKVANNGGFFGDFANNDTGFGGIGYQQMGGRGSNLMENRVIESNTNQNSAQAPPNLPLNVNGVRTDLQQRQQQPNKQPQQQQIFPKQPALGYSNQLPLHGGAQLGSPGIRGGIMGIRDQGLVQGGGMGMVCLGTGPINGSPASQLLPNGISKSNGDTSSVSPVPYVFNGGRGRKMSGPVQKVVERRQRRMIKNRESAARSRARKQAYTMELEQEVAKLKEENQQLQKKQDEIVEMQKNQALEMMSVQSKRRCLRRTQTGPW